MARDKAESREKALCVFGGFETPHFLLAQSRGLVGIFRSIVESFVLPMLHAWQDLAFGCSIALQFVGDDHAWDVLESFEELPKKASRRVCVPSALDEDIEHVAVLIHGSPQIIPLSTDREKDARPACHLSPHRGRRRRSSLAYICPNFKHHWRTVS
jgi:hypothetical protein